MASITAGSGATITPTSVERFLASLIWRLQSLEGDVVRNPTGINNVTSTMSDDNYTLSATCNFMGVVTDDSQGRMVIEAIDYLTVPTNGSPHWVPGTGGTISSPTIQGAIFESARLIDNLESQSLKNPQNKKCVSYSVGSATLGSGTSNVPITITITNLPLTTSLNTEGSQVVLAKEYLL